MEGSHSSNDGVQGLESLGLWTFFIVRNSDFFLNLFIAFLQSTQDISKRDGCVYLKQVPSSDGSLELI
jgi:hypothetical protein